MSIRIMIRTGLCTHLLDVNLNFLKDNTTCAQLLLVTAESAIELCTRSLYIISYSNNYFDVVVVVVVMNYEIFSMLRKKVHNKKWFMEGKIALIIWKRCMVNAVHLMSCLFSLLLKLLYLCPPNLPLNIFASCRYYFIAALTVMHY